MKTLSLNTPILTQKKNYILNKHYDLMETKEVYMLFTILRNNRVVLELFTIESIKENSLLTTCLRLPKFLVSKCTFFK